MHKPDVDEIAGICPAISIRQKNAADPKSSLERRNSDRDIRLPQTAVCVASSRHSAPECGEKVKRDTPESASSLFQLPEGRLFYVLLPGSGRDGGTSRKLKRRRETEETRTESQPPAENSHRRAIDELDAARIHATFLQRPVRHDRARHTNRAKLTGISITSVRAGGSVDRHTLIRERGWLISRGCYQEGHGRQLSKPQTTRPFDWYSQKASNASDARFDTLRPSRNYSASTIRSAPARLVRASATRSGWTSIWSFPIAS